jgi:16S rRNA A1518/A1519 N6-dimethyltransferase RsmA/KsgA/DIM1 with predicted DNA glycosylase/AP lyase activity
VHERHADNDIPTPDTLIPDGLVLDTARLDQHLLSNTAAVRRLVDTARLTRHDVVADLGAGTGVITRELIRRSPGRIHAVEIDVKFGPFLEPLSRAGHDVELIWADILDTHLPDATKVVANPPFRITEHLIGWLADLPALTTATMVIGRSFGVRATAAPGSPHYTRLSLRVQARYTAQVIDTLSPRDFHPPTRTPACIIHLTPKRPPARIDEAVDHAFTHRGGMRVKDLLWHLYARCDALGPPSTRRRITAALRRSEAVVDVYQRRLQQITSAELSRFMAELHRQAT